MNAAVEKRADNAPAVRMGVIPRFRKVCFFSGQRVGALVTLKNNVSVFPFDAHGGLSASGGT